MKKSTNVTLTSAPAVWTGLFAVALVALAAFVAMSTKPSKPMAAQHKTDNSPPLLHVTAASDVPASGSLAAALQPQPDASTTRSIPELSAGVDAQELGAPTTGSTMQANSSSLQGSNSNPAP